MKIGSMTIILYRSSSNEFLLAIVKFLDHFMLNSVPNIST